MYKYTEGPWIYDGHECVQPVGEADDLAVCVVLPIDRGGPKGFYRGPETEANARLLGAAPEVFEAMVQLADAVEGGMAKDLAQALAHVHTLVVQVTGERTCRRLQ